MFSNFKYPKGSEWGKWDLHVHTPIDHEWKDKPNIQNMDEKRSFAKDFIKFAKDENLSLIAITDHNFCNDINQSILPLIQEEAKKENITILPGFEVTVKDGNGLHILIVFPESTELIKILNIVNQLFPPNFEKIPKNGQIPQSNKTIDEIKSIISDSQLEAIFILAHADSKNGILNKSTIKGTSRRVIWEKNYIGITQLVQPTTNYTSGFEYEVINRKNPDFKKEMAFIYASDCRCISKTKLNNEDGRTYLGQKYCWIKSNPTFEGLKHIIYDPDNRIKMPADIPEYKTNYLVIDKVRFIDTSGKSLFSNNWIEINPNLNTIIGGKSSGKSLLLYYVAKTIDENEVKTKSELSQQKYNFDSDDKFDFEVKWKDGIIHTLKNKNDKNRKVTYVPQLYINKLTEKEGELKLQSQIHDILLQNNEIKIFYDRILKDINENQLKISQYYNNLFVKLNNLKELKKQLGDLGDKNAILNEKTSIDRQIEDLREKSGFKKSETKKYEKLKYEKELKDAEILKNESIVKTLENYKEEINVTLENFIFNINLKKDEVGLISLEKEILLKINKNIEKEFNKIIEDNFSIINEYSGKIENIKKERAQIMVELQPYISKIENQYLLGELNRKLSTQIQLLKQIEEKQKSIDNLNNAIREIKESTIEEYNKLIGNYNKIVAELNNTKYKNISPDIELEAKLAFDETLFHNQFTVMVDKRGNLSKSMNFFVNNVYSYNELNHITNIKFLFEELLNENSEIIKLKDKKERKEAVEQLLNNYFTVQYDLIHNSDRIMQMSPGKRGLVLLQLILHISNAQHPILIDQPEDNLDNRTISQELIDYIGKKKLDRQIILVTHNANLVVLTDAEEVIVANQSGQKSDRENEKYRFEYVSGGLECSFNTPTANGILNKMGIKQHVCEILEGGEEAFEKRERKYGLNK